MKFGLQMFLDVMLMMSKCIKPEKCLRHRKVMCNAALYCQCVASVLFMAHFTCLVDNVRHIH